MNGWHELVDAVESVHVQHPDATVLTRNYSEAGAIELLAPDLPAPASGHNSYWDWGPPAGDPDAVIVLGRDRSVIDDAFTSVRRIATVHSPGGVHNHEDGTPIWLASGRRRAWSDLWPRLRRV